MKPVFMATVCFAFSAVGCFASGAKMLKAVDLPEMNLSFMVMTDSKQTPAPPPNVYTRTIESGEEEIKEDAFLFSDLWRHSQTACRWTDRFNNVFTLAEAVSMLPGDSGSKFVTREQYVRMMPETGAPEWTDEKLLQWVSDFVNQDVSMSRPVSIARHRRLADLIEFEQNASPKNLIMFAFRLDTGLPGQTRAPSGWFLAVLQLVGDADRLKSRDSMVDNFLKSISVSRGAQSELASASARRPPASAPADSAGRSASFDASRRQVMESIRNMPEWWFAETRNYIILCNLKSRDSTLLRRLKSELEALRGCFVQCVPPRSDISAVSVIRIFATPDEYVRYVGNDASAGVWMAGKNELVIRMPENSRAVSEVKKVMETVYHEAFHQYLYYAMNRTETSAWFNEGHATFFEGCKVGVNRITVEEDADYYYWLRKMISAGSVDIAKLIRMDYADFYAGKKENNYALAWALVYFLRKNEMKGNLEKYASINDDYCDALIQCKNHAEATAAAFKDIDIAQFQEDFIKFWQTPYRRDKARRERIFPSFRR